MADETQTVHDERELASREPLPAVKPRLWGRDHLSTLAYVETRTVDARGRIENERMRTNADRHPSLLGDAQRRAGLTGTGGRHPTRLSEEASEMEREAVKELGHDDWDCLDDLIREGLVELRAVTLRDGHPDRLKVRVGLTKRGRRLASEIREHLAQAEHGGAGSLDSFEMPRWIRD